MDKKYKLVWVGGAFPVAGWGAVYRIKALRDIPKYNVEAGDYGGFVSSGSILSHEGDCWISDEAAVYGNVKVQDNAHISGHAKVINRSARKKGYIYSLTTICGNSQISGAAFLDGVGWVKENAKISGKTEILHAKFIAGDAVISDLAKIGSNCIISGDSVVSGNSKMFMHSVVFNNEIVKGEVILDNGTEFVTKERTFSYLDQKSARLQKPKTDAEIIDRWMAEMMEKNPEALRKSAKGTLNVVTSQEINARKTLQAKKTPELPVETKDALNLLSEIKEEVEAYTHDIVKIIKYPIMADRTDTYTVEMMQALKTANRLSKNPSHPKFVEAIMDLEKKFMAAESNAIKLSATLLSDDDRKKVTKAKDLLAIASNEASSEQEKKSAFVQGFKQLEGIIVVPEEAVEAFRIKYHLKEIEA